MPFSMLLTGGTASPIVPTVIEWSDMVTSATFAPIIESITGLVPTILAFTLTISAIRLGLRWINGAVGGKRR